MKLEPVKWDESTAWNRYAGFLDMSMSTFQDVQDHLLMEQVRTLKSSPLGMRAFQFEAPRTPEEFRQKVRITTYADYLEALDPTDPKYLPDADYAWAHTTGAQARFKHVPYTKAAYERMLDNVFGAFLIASAHQKGQVNVRPGDRIMFNVPPRPYLSGLVAFGMRDRFGFHGIIEPEEAEHMEFKSKIRENFARAMRERVDLIVSMTSVLLRAGESFELGRKGGAKSEKMDLNWRAKARYLKAKAKSLLFRRPPRAGDVWNSRGIIGWGVDTGIFKEQVERYWGRRPMELYACTEGGVMGAQPWDSDGIAPNPYMNYLEFMTLEDAEKLRADRNYMPKLLRLADVEPGREYELIITSFNGMPFIRYRLGHRVRFLDRSRSGDRDVPHFEFLGRGDDRIDIAGFTRVDEKTLWEAVRTSKIPVAEWTARSESVGGRPILHFYAEATGPIAEDVAEQLHETLLELDPFYKDLEQMLGIRPVKVTLLPNGTWDRYYDVMRLSGAELADRVPPRINASDNNIERLIALSTEKPERLEQAVPA